MPSLNITNVIVNLNAYCQEHFGQIYADAMLGLANYFAKANIELWENIKHQLPIINGRIGHIVQPGNYTAWTPTQNAIVLDNRMLEVGKAKVDLNFFAQDLEFAWTQHLYAHARVTNKLEETPYHSFIVGQIVQSVARDIREGIWKGDINGATLDHLKVINGLIFTMRADAALGNVPVVDVTTYLGGGIFDNNIYKAINYIKDASSDVQYDENQGMTMYVPRAIYDMAVNGTDIAAGRTIYFEEIPGMGTTTEKVFKFRGSNISMIPEYNLAYDGVTGNAQICMSVNRNIIVGTGELNQANIIEFQKTKREISALMDFKYGVNYANASAANRNVIVTDMFL